MELLFLGTGAGELWPSLFCPCETCRGAVRNRGADGRIGACLLVDRTYLFDVPPNSAMAALNAGVSLADVTDLFVTHSHQDHFDPCVLAARGCSPEHPLHLYCNERLAGLLPVYQQFNRFFNPDQLGLQLEVMAPGTVRRPSSGAFTLTALLADHDRTQDEEPLVFIFEAGSRRLLYACDTGWIPEQSWCVIERHDYDAVILDCTFHLQRECRHGHLGLAAFLEQKARFDAAGLLKGSAGFVAQHIARGHGADQVAEEDIVAALAAHGVLVAHDGMRLEL